MAIVDVITMNRMNTPRGPVGMVSSGGGSAKNSESTRTSSSASPSPTGTPISKLPSTTATPSAAGSGDDLGRVGAHGAKDRELAAAFEHEECAEHGDSDGGDQRGSERFDATEPCEVQCGKASLERVSDRCHAESIGQGSAEFGGHHAGRVAGGDAGEVEVGRRGHRLGDRGCRHDQFGRLIGRRGRRRERAVDAEDMELQVRALFEIVRIDGDRQRVTGSDLEIDGELFEQEDTQRVVAERLGALTLQDPRCHRGHVGIGGQVDRHDRLAVASRLGGHEAEGADGGDPGPRAGSWFVGSSGVRRMSEPKAARASVTFAVR